MYALGSKCIEKLITPLLLVAGTTLALSSFSTAAYAVSLDELYTTMMTIRGCETVVSEEDWENLTFAIEQTVSNSGASSDTVNGIFDDIKSQMSADLAAYCTDHADDVTAVLEALN
jgi:hypothetical protein